MRKKREVSDPEGWTGTRVAYSPRPGSRETGIVQRLASGKIPAAFVLYDGDSAAKLTYLRDLERLI